MRKLKEPLRSLGLLLSETVGCSGLDLEKAECVESTLEGATGAATLSYSGSSQEGMSKPPSPHGRIIPQETYHPAVTQGPL